VPDSQNAKVLQFPDLAPKARRQLMQPELGTQYDSMDRMFAYWADGSVLDYGEWTSRDMETMLVRDGQAAAIEAVITLPIRQAATAIEKATGDKGEADFCRSVLMTPHTGGGMETPLQDVIGQLTSAQTFRKAFFEKVWNIRDSDGKIVYDKLAFRPASTCEQKRNARTAAREGFVQRDWLFGAGAMEIGKPKSKTPGYVEIPQIRSWVYVNGKHRKPLTGTSELDLCYWALAYNSEVQTPNGPVAIEDLYPGDFVFGSDGEPTEVLDVLDRGVQPMYRIRFDDQTSVLCSADHLWTVAERRTNGNAWTKTVPTSYMIKTGLRLYDGFRFMVPLCGEVQYPERDLIIDPYVMGAYLGDGGVQRTRNGINTPTHGIQSPTFTCDEDDAEIITEIELRLSPGIELRRHDALHYGVTDTLKVKQNRFRDALVTLGVAVRSPEKFIPQIYLTASSKQRWDLLRGLMDTDGHAREKTRSMFTSTSERLARDVQLLVQSLGGRATVTGPKWSDGGTLDGHVITRRHATWIVFITTPEPAFLLKRKADKWGGGGYERKNNFKSVVSIEPEGEKECRCITVANEDGLFLADNYTVTHNCYQTKLKLVFLLAALAAILGTAIIA
jgi:intein/homing endonuclease